MGEGLLNSSKALPLPLLDIHNHRSLWLHQHSILHLSSAWARGSYGLFSWPLGTHSVLTLPIIAWPTVNTYKSSHELKFLQQSSAHAQGPQNTAPSLCFLSALEHNPRLLSTAVTEPRLNSSSWIDRATAQACHYHAVVHNANCLAWTKQHSPKQQWSTS